MRDTLLAPRCTDGQGHVQDHAADGWLISPEDSPIVTMCQGHAAEVITEYGEKLGETWTFRPATDDRTVKTPTGVEMDHATTIAQIGRITLGSVGARAFTRSTDALSFTISRGHRRVTVTLDPDDTYHVQTVMIRSGKVAYDATGIYCDQLAEAVWQAHIEERS